MDSNQLIIAFIGAFSTLLGAWLSSRSKQKPGVVPSKRSARKTLIKFAVYFLLGGAATYWVMNSLLPFGRIDERLSTLEMHAQSLARGISTPGVTDSTTLPLLPVGTIILSALPPDMFGSLPDHAGHWSPADGRTLDSSSTYVALTGSMRAPDLRAMRVERSVMSSTGGADSTVQRIIRASDANGVQPSDSTGNTMLYWYVRVK